MAADYPAAITDLGPGLTGVPLGPEHPQHHTDLRDEIVAIETELGVNPSGAFGNVGARLSILEENVFFVDSPEFGAVGDGTTDDTDAIRAAIAAAETAGGGIVQLGAKTYLVNGPLVTTEGGYAILPLPTGVPIHIRGVQPANNCDPRTSTGYSIIKTTKTGLTRSGTYGVPSVIGGPTDSTWAESTVSLEDFCLWLPANPTMAGIDLWHVRRCVVDGVNVQAINTGDADYTLPTSVHAFALRTPEPLNYNAVLIRNAQAHGTYAGLVGSVESMTVDYWVSKWCVVGWGPAPGGHGASVQKMDLSWCPYGISGWTETAGATSVPTGALGETEAQMHVSYLAIEDYAGASKWYDPVKNINDSTNRLKGVVFFDQYTMGTGIGSTLSKTGGTNLTTISLRSPSFGAGGGSTQYTKRDRLTAAAGNTTLTLGATPIEDSVHVWVDNVIKWPGVDYTRSGAVLTFGSALTAGQVVLSSYATTNASAPAAALSSPAVTYNDRIVALSPLAYWKLDESDTVNILDWTGSGRHLTKSGGISHSQTSLLTSGAGKSELFTGGSGLIASAAWMETDYVSVVMRYQPRSADLATGLHGLLSRWLDGVGATNYCWMLAIKDGKAMMQVHNNTGAELSALSGATTLVADTPYTIGMTWDGTTAKLYVNGALDASAAYSGVLRKGSASGVSMAQIAGANVGGGYFDEVALFGTVVSAANMAAIHTSAITA